MKENLQTYTRNTLTEITPAEQRVLASQFVTAIYEDINLANSHKQLFLPPIGATIFAPEMKQQFPAEMELCKKEWHARLTALHTPSKSGGHSADFTFTVSAKKGSRTAVRLEHTTEAELIASLDELQSRNISCWRAKKDGIQLPLHIFNSAQHTGIIADVLESGLLPDDFRNLQAIQQQGRGTDIPDTTARLRQNHRYQQAVATLNFIERPTEFFRDLLNNDRLIESSRLMTQKEVEKTMEEIKGCSNTFGPKMLRTGVAGHRSFGDLRIQPSSYRSGINPQGLLVEHVHSQTGTEPADMTTKSFPLPIGVDGIIIGYTMCHQQFLPHSEVPSRVWFSNGAEVTYWVSQAR